MAGHSHWAGIKHKKGRQDKERSRIFSKLSREITVAAKLGAKDPDTNPRLRTAIQTAKQFNMPKDNITRAIKKSEMNLSENFENLRYEGFGPFNVAFIIETLTDNKNRSAGSIRAILQKSGGRLGETGSTSHMFFSCGVMHLTKDTFSDEKILEIAINAGAKDCRSGDKFHEILSEKEDFYKVKNAIEKISGNLIYSGIEWKPHVNLELTKDQQKKILEIIESLDEVDDVQKIFINVNIDLASL
ncbi:MAG: YebC/PmpR family DNA-binding transcriptional regulator [Pelagibacterales bacterium MED-G40]|nr:MAG: YebC/PmpR family DNA-binding transcriptional regulator [Pelagibacterales bacterium MED-G40]